MLLHENKKLKASALAKLNVGMSVEEVADEMALPITLVEEWKNSVTSRDMAVTLGAGLARQALISDVTKAVETIENTEEVLENVRLNIALAANKIAQEVSTNSIISFDLERAKSIQLLAEALGTIYGTLFKTNISLTLPNSGNSPGGPMSSFYTKD